MKKLLIVALSATLLACGGGSKEYTVDELYNDNALRDKIIAECKQKPNPKEDINCKNAAIAHKRHFSGSGGEVHQWQ